MLLYRISNSKYSLDLSGTGAALSGGRWNPIDKKMLYASAHASLCALEIIVNARQALFAIDYELVTIEVPDSKNMLHADEVILGSNWQDNIALTQNFGLHFLQTPRLLASVPSVIVPEENNYLINPNHESFGKVRIVAKRPFYFDKRIS